METKKKREWEITPTVNKLWVLSGKMCGIFQPHVDAQWKGIHEEHVTGEGIDTYN